MAKKTPYLILFIGIALAVAYFAPKSLTSKIVNYNDTAQWVKELYLTSNARGDDQKCFLSGRSGSTLRRSDAYKKRNRSWCHYGDEGSVVVSRKRKPSIILIPLTDARKSDSISERVHLYRNRVSAGTYLVFTFPYEKWKTHKRNIKERREIIIYGDKRIYVLDTLLRPVEAPKSIEYSIKNRDIRPHYPKVLLQVLEHIDFGDFTLKNFYRGAN
ncbi:MAG: hypothetical protein KAG61_02570 [Bacteriovoracaceae bacterium]|nr:hypothetical protein [Bacteriovoracaceae bacterium]